MKKPLELNRMDFHDIVYQADLEEDNISTTYSGRGMFGATCLSITVEHPNQMAKFWIEVGKKIAEYERDDKPVEMGFDLEALSDAVRSDNMGLDTVYYFPGYTLSE